MSSRFEFSGRLLWFPRLGGALVQSFEAYVFVLPEERGDGTLSGWFGVVELVLGRSDAWS